MMTAILQGDCIEILSTLPAKSAQCVVTSPPYWGLRSYGFKPDDPAHKKLIGLEPTFDRHLWNLVRVFREVRRVLRDDGTVWLNYGDSYDSGDRATYRSGASQNKGHHVQNNQARPRSFIGPKQLIGMAWRVAFALQADGWILRSDIIWAKRSPMPESVTDRPTKAHEYVFLFSKSPRYFFDQEAGRETTTNSDTHSKGRFSHEMPKTVSMGQGIKNNGSFSAATWDGVSARNMRSVWTLSTEPTKDAHFATFPTELVARCLKPGTSAKGCCPTCGAPWKRIVKGERVATRPATAPKRQGINDKPANRDGGRHVSINRQSEWQPGCEHGGGSVPCRVLDPFAGAGTVGVVCRRMGLDFTGIELNPDYCAIAQRRIDRAMDEPEPEVPQVVGQLELIA